MKRLGIALALATLAGVALAPAAQADDDDRREHLARSGGHGLGHHVGRGAGPRWGRDDDRGYRHGHRRHRGHGAGRHRWNRPSHRWHAPRWHKAPRHRHYRGHGKRYRHGRTRSYGAGVGFVIDGITFGIVEYGRR